MSNFYNWEDVLKVEGIREEVLKFAIKDNALQEEDNGALPLDERELQDLFERAISEMGEVVFYFSGDGQEQVSSHCHYKFAGKYFEFDGHDQITGPCDDNNPEVLIELCEDHLAGERPRNGFLVSIGGEFPDEYFTERCLKLVNLGQELKINGQAYLRTKAGFELKK